MLLLRAFVLLFPLAILARAQSTANCPIADIQPTGSVDGTLSRTDCRITGIMVWESEETVMQQYRFTVTQPGALTVKLYSTAYAPSFSVRDARGNWVLSVTDYDQNSHADGMVSVPPGTYTIVVTSWGYATGPFKLTTTFEPLHQCSIRELKFGDTVIGDFAKSVCRQLDLQVPSTSIAGVERFRLTVDGRGIATVNVTSGIFVSARLYDSANREVAGLRQDKDGLKLVLTASLDAGVYLLDLRGEPDRGTGAFTLTATFEAFNPERCQLNTLRLGEEITGTLGSTGCRFMDLSIGSPDRSQIDPYLVTVPARGVLGVALSSGSVWFAADLMLFDTQGRQLSVRSSAGAPSPAAQLSASVDPASYRIYVRNTGRDTALYRLKATFDAPRDCAPRSLGLDTMVSGVLSDAGCRVLDRIIPSADDSPQASYAVKVERRGVLALDLIPTYPLEAALRLLSTAGGVVATAQAKGGAASGRIETVVEPGVYTVEVRGLRQSVSYGPTGPFTLKTAFQDLAPRSCPGRDLALNDSVSGNLNPASCRLLDALPGSSSVAPVDVYRITLAEAGTLTLDMVSTDLDAFLALYDKNLSMLASDDNSGGGKNARLMMSLNPGTYTIHARASDGKTGAYSLNLSFQPAGSAICPVADLPLAGSVTEALSASDCRMLDLLRPSSNAAYVDRYRIVMPRRGVLSLDLASTSFTPWIAIYDSRSSQVASAFGSTGGSAKLSASLNAGEYIVYASSSGARTGAYTLLSTFREMVGAGCPIVDIAPGATVQGVIGDINCRVLDLVVPSSDTSFVGQYRVTAPRRSILTIEMESASFDPSLRLNDDQSRTIVSSQAQRPVMARIVATVDAAAYIIHARSGSTGTFTLRTRLQDAPAPDCAARGLDVNGAASGTLDQGGCRGKDIIQNGTDHSYAAQYKLVVTERGTLSIQMNSSAFTPQATLYRPPFDSIVFSSFDGATGTVTLSANLTLGEYILVARSQSLGTGSFTLRTSFQAAPPPSCPTSEIGLDEAVEGALAVADCTLQDLLPPKESQAFAHRYRVTVAGAGNLQVELASADFVPAVSLVGEDGQVVAEASAGPDEAMARIGADVQPGSYLIVVTSIRPATGRYTLKAVFQPAEGGAAASP